MKKQVFALFLLAFTFWNGYPGLSGFTQQVYAEYENQSVSVNMMVNAASIVIRQRAGMPLENDNLTISLLGSPADLVVPAGELNLLVSLPYGVRYNAPTTAIVTVEVDGKVAAVDTLKFDVNLYQQVLVAARPIVKGETLNAGNISYARMDVGRLTTGYYTDLSAVEGLVSRRMLNPGTPLNKYLIEKPVLVKRNSSVMIVARMGGIEVTTYGQALQDGQEGQIIRVQNINSRKLMTAKVVDVGTVEVMTFRP